MNSITSNTIPLQRDCKAIQIPSGIPTTLSHGTLVVLTQSLGGTYTVAPQTGGLFSIAHEDGDALGMDITENSPSDIDPNEPLDEEKIWNQLKTCFDPEIPVNIVDLGLIYDLKIIPFAEQKNRVEVKMTLTAQGCGMGTFIAADAKAKILKIPGVSEAEVSVVWDPPWNPAMISPEGKSKLGMT